MKEEKEIHPWEEFLKWRYEAMLWTKKTFGDSNKEIASKFSMDEEQVSLILKENKKSIYGMFKFK